jgi:ribosomal-protein-alanine N-acetyltransferase
LARRAGLGPEAEILPPVLGYAAWIIHDTVNVPEIKGALMLHFRTNRLMVADWAPHLAVPEPLTAALGPVLTPSVLAHLPPSMQLDPEQGIPAWITARAAESTVLTVTDTSNDTLAGLVVLHHDEQTCHLGYLLAESAWGRGLGSELIAGLVTAMTPMAPMTVVGGVGHDNPASARVLVKSGFAKDTASSPPDTDLYRLTL